MSKHGDVWVSPCGRMELRCGRWQDVLADVERVDAVITDPPYGERTHAGQRHGRRRGGNGQLCSTRPLGYAAMTPEHVGELVGRWSDRCAGWMTALTSHDLVHTYIAVAEGCGRYAFAPLACVQTGMSVRLAGDGPSSWTTWLTVSRPRSLRAWGTLPGAYVGTPGNGLERSARAVSGGKPLWLMRAIVRDYSRPGDLVCDPCAGGATTLLAAAMEGRRAIGAEMDPKTFDLAVKRLSKGYTPDLFAAADAGAQPEQMTLGGDDG